MPDLNQPRFTAMQQLDAHQYVEDFLKNKHPPWLYELYLHWRQLYEEPFRGVTVDGESAIFSKRRQVLCLTLSHKDR